jgi:hypothetical protein
MDQKLMNLLDRFELALGEMQRAVMGMRECVAANKSPVLMSDDEYSAFVAKQTKSGKK